MNYTNYKARGLVSYIVLYDSSRVRGPPLRRHWLCRRGELFQEGLVRRLCDMDRACALGNFCLDDVGTSCKADGRQVDGDRFVYCTDSEVHLVWRSEDELTLRLKVLLCRKPTIS
eukprot:3167084-Amphidinium_carterae.1